MTRLERYFADYASYHRDPRNGLTHALGIPMIVTALLMWAGGLTLAVADGVRIDVGMMLVVVAGAVYVALSLPLGVAMTVALALLHVLGVRLLDADPWLALWLFLGGWALQLVGHAFEGRRPAFLKNATHLLVGPLWVLRGFLGGLGRGGRVSSEGPVAPTAER
jgi:uncharacterized membrane protein YGL010W